MRVLLRVCVVILALSSTVLLLNLFDAVSFPTPLYRAFGVTCLVSLFLTVYTRVWLIRHRRKYRYNKRL